MSRIFNTRTLVLGGLAAAAAAAALKNRAKVAGLIGVRSSEPEPYQPQPTTPTPPPTSADAPAAPPATVSNYDAPGPPANTATPVPAPEPVIHEGGIDEEAEERAAAAEAANIGGEVPEYAPSTLGEKVDEEDRPLEEAGEGIAEGQEQAEGDLADNAEPSAGDPIAGQRSLEDAIEAESSPGAGEHVETHDHIHPDEVERASSAGGETSAAEKSSAVWRTQEEAPTEEQPAPAEPATATEEAAASEPPAAKEEDDDGGEWQTWSGRAVDR
jgi:hypothetical protein